jgi:L-arabinose isomerase
LHTATGLLQSAKSAAALERLVARFRLTGLAYYYGGREDSPQRLLSSSLIVGSTLLQAKGFPVCGEYDIKTCLAMLIMDRLGIGGSFAELHPFDFDGDFILIGHDGPHHMGIAEGRPALRSLTRYHGKPGSGASVEFKIR